jgi:hypothetical protein
VTTPGFDARRELVFAAWIDSGKGIADALRQITKPMLLSEIAPM